MPIMSKHAGLPQHHRDHRAMLRAERLANADLVGAPGDAVRRAPRTARSRRAAARPSPKATDRRASSRSWAVRSSTSSASDLATVIGSEGAVRRTARRTSVTSAAGSPLRAQQIRHRSARVHRLRHRHEEARLDLVAEPVAARVAGHAHDLIGGALVPVHLGDVKADRIPAVEEQLRHRLVDHADPRPAGTVLRADLAAPDEPECPASRSSPGRRGRSAHRDRRRPSGV